MAALSAALGLADLLSPLLQPVNAEVAAPPTVTAAAAANDPLSKNFLLFMVHNLNLENNAKRSIHFVHLPHVKTYYMCGSHFSR
jgi:hypothetical protein